MPNIVAHCWYGEAAYTKSNTDYVRKCIQKYHGVFMLGCQGPDPFYFYHRMPWQSKKDRKKVMHYGDILHNEHINDTFEVFFKYVKETKNPLDIAYVAGFMCHWALDTTCHPYIYFETDSLNKNIGNAHQAFETMIDKGVLMVNDLDVRDFQTYKLLKHPEETTERVWKILADVFKKCDGLDLEFRHLDESVRQFHSVQKLFYDPTGRKHKLVGVAENIAKMKGVGTGMMIPREYDYEMDPMNFKKREWLHPCDKNVKSTETFEEMASKAVGIMLALLKTYEDYLNDKAEISDLLDIIADRSFDTGLAPGAKMQYFCKDMENENI